MTHDEEIERLVLIGSEIVSKFRNAFTDYMISKMYEPENDSFLSTRLKVLVNALSQILTDLKGHAYSNNVCTVLLENVSIMVADDYSSATRFLDLLKDRITNAEDKEDTYTCMHGLDHLIREFNNTILTLDHLSKKDKL